MVDGEDKPQVGTGTVSVEGDLPMARVGYACGLTLNLGNYESYRIDVSVEVPVRASETAMAAMYDKARRWVDQRVQAEADRVKGTTSNE